MSRVNWAEVVKYDESSPSCLRWACNIPYKGTFGDSVSYKRIVGDVAGSFQKSAGRYKLKYNQKAYMAHRIIYELFHGEIDDSLVIDHIDGDASNNVITNLRLVSIATNTQNSGKRTNNSTGVTGVAKFEVTSTYGVTYVYYAALWSENGKDCRKNFSVTKLGDDLAFKAACHYREDKVIELNANGANYTERHGL